MGKMQKHNIYDFNNTEQKIFNEIYKAGLISKNKIASRTGISPATVSRVVNNLEKMEVIDAKNREQAGGRFPVKYKVSKIKNVVFSAFISFEICGISIGDMHGEINSVKTKWIKDDTIPSEIVNFFKEFIENELEKLSLQKENVLGIGIGVLGPILKDKGIVYKPYHLNQNYWDNVGIKNMMEIATGFPTYVDNLAEVALLSEMFQRFDENELDKNLALLWFDKGIGCGVYSNGSLGFGKIDISPNFGHMVINFKGDSCICGKKGCLETYASIEAIYKKIKKLLSTKMSEYDLKYDINENNIWETCPKLHNIVNIKKYSYEEIREIIEEAELALRYALMNFIQLFNANKIFYGGRFVLSFQKEFQSAIKYVLNDGNINHYKDLQFVESKIDKNLFLKGGIFLVVNKILKIIHES